MSCKHHKYCTRISHTPHLRHGFSRRACDSLTPRAGAPTATLLTYWRRLRPVEVGYRTALLLGGEHGAHPWGGPASISNPCNLAEGEAGRHLDPPPPVGWTERSVRGLPRGPRRASQQTLAAWGNGVSAERGPEPVCFLELSRGDRPCRPRSALQQALPPWWKEPGCWLKAGLPQLEFLSQSLVKGPFEAGTADYFQGFFVKVEGKEGGPTLRLHRVEPKALP